MSKKLISLNELQKEDLPLQTENNTQFIKEDDLERFLIVNRYNIYDRNENLTYQDVINDDWVLDSTMICDVMADLGFDVTDDENEELLFFITC